MTGIGRTVVIAGTTALVLAAGASLATAAVMSSAGPVDSSGVIHGCWTDHAVNGSHTFVLQNVGSRCPTGTTAISWNKSGPPGPTGSPGPSGPSGPPGPSGAAGTVSSLDQLNGIPCDSGAGTTQLSYGDNGSVSITCATPTPTTTGSTSSSGSATASPDNTQATAQALPGMECGGSPAVVTGDNLAGTSGWWRFSSVGLCEDQVMTVNLSGGTGDTLYLWSGSNLLTTVQGGQSLSLGYESGDTFQVTGGTEGISFTLTVSESL